MMEPDATTLPSTAPASASRFRGMLLGTAVGDALGLPGEGLPRNRALRLFGERPRHRFVCGKGMLSDDTEHTIFVSQCLLAHGAAVDSFLKRLAWRLRWWFAALPAGVGWATARASVRLWLGVNPRHSGVCSAGNGPTMRATPIGAFFASDPERLDAFVEASSRLTHTDPRAAIGAKAVAYAAARIVKEDLSARPDWDESIEDFRRAGPDDDEWARLLERMWEAGQSQLSVADFADSLGLRQGVTGYIYHTVPVALYAWGRHFGDFEETVAAVLRCGGDTDSAGAVAGALAGLTVGEEGIPGDWIQGVRDWPLSTQLLRRLADEMARAVTDGKQSAPIPYCWPAIVPRNLCFLAIVLAHGLARLLRLRRRG